jgi:hypothetical protein
MTFWHPQPRLVLGLTLAIAGTSLIASPANAVPLIGIGANVGAGVHFLSGGQSPAMDLNADLSLLGPVIGLQYWRPFDGSQNYLQAGVRYNVSPIPMVSIQPGISGINLNGGWGGLGTVNAVFSPLMLPFSVEAMVGAGYVNAGLLLPYSVGVKLSLIPFTAINVRYRGWSGPLNVSGPELGLEIGL